MSEISRSLIPQIAQEISQILETSRSEAQKEMERIAVSANWKIGKVLIKNNFSLDTQTSFELLGAETHIEKSTLYRCLQLAQLWPAENPSETHPSVTWSHYKALIPLASDQARAFYLKEIEDKSLSVRELSQEIKDQVFENPRLENTNSTPEVLNRKSNRLHIYKASVQRVVDGDTLDVKIDLGFDVWVQKRLRLRGIDCAEAGTPQGERATECVKLALPPEKTVVIQTFQVDLHGRFVVDLFVHAESDDKEEILSEGVFFNQQLLDQGLATLV